MHVLDFPCKIFSLGDAAITLDLGNHIGMDANRKILAIQQWIMQHPFEGMKDCRIAYSSITLVYDPVGVKKAYRPAGTVHAYLRNYLQNAFEQAREQPAANGRQVRIPVCYDAEFALDIKDLARQKQLTPEKIIELHSSRTYRVYMIGFLPGFSYMGEVHEQLRIPRKPVPVMVAAGSVGITASQTGIYPLHCPGGWYIIGRTPLNLFNPGADMPVLLQPGDEVQFIPINKDLFREYLARQEQNSRTP